MDYNLVTNETIITVISKIDTNEPSMTVTYPDGTTSTEPYRVTNTHTDSPDDIDIYFQPSAATLLQYSVTVHENAQVNITYDAEYQGNKGYILNVITRNMKVESTEDTIAVILSSNFIEDSGASSNHLDTTEVTVTVIRTG